MLGVHVLVIRLAQVNIVDVDLFKGLLTSVAESVITQLFNNRIVFF